MKKRIGILGGTFNPIHMGHLLLAEQSRQFLRLKKVIFIPTYFSPHKTVKALAPAQQRYDMVTLALQANPYFAVSDLELQRGGISYSVETVKKLKSIFRRTSLYFIVGSDFLNEFSAWKDIDKINRICKFAVAQRPGFTFTQPRRAEAGFKKLSGNMRWLNITALDISSKDIRKRIRTKQSIRYLVPEGVRKYILQKRLFQ